MCKYEMDPMSILEDTEQTRFCPQTDRLIYGQTDKVIPVYPPFNFVEAGGIIKSLLPRFWIMFMSKIASFKMADDMMTLKMETISALLALCAGNSQVTDEFPSQRPVIRSFDVSLICAWLSGWVNNREAGDLQCHHAHYDIIVMEVLRNFKELQVLIKWYPWKHCPSNLKWCLF